MTATEPTRTVDRRAYLRFAGHYVEMVIAMMVGMFALGPLWSLAAADLVARGDAGAMIMATDMTLGMALWMWIRRHSWRRIAEMSIAMYLPFVVLLVPYWFGAVSADVVMMGGHVGMFVTMFAAMLWRPEEYLHHRH